jgi:hypothetical protein
MSERVRDMKKSQKLETEDKQSKRGQHGPQGATRAATPAWW